MDKNNLPENLPENFSDLNKSSPTDNSQKQKIIKVVVGIILFIGSMIFVIDRLFTDYEQSDPTDTQVEKEDPYWEGSVKYVSPYETPDERIKFRLTYDEGNHIVFLRSDDEKLDLSENLYVKVIGLPTKTSDGEDVLIVQELIVSR